MLRYSMVAKRNKVIKVMLTESINKDKAGQVINARPGYAAYLVSSGQGIFEKGNEELIQSKLEEWKIRDTKKAEEAKKSEEIINSIKLVMERKSGFNGLLYGSITATDIAKELQLKGCSVKKGDIFIDKQIRSLGKYDILVGLYGGIKAKMQIEVVHES